MKKTYDVVYFTRHRISEHQVRTGRAVGTIQRPPPRVSTWTEPFLCFVYYFYAAQSAGRHETRACPLADAQNGHGHMGQ
jgi:hypothetical protein